MSCISDSDCQSLGSSFRCESGFCRAGDVVCPLQVLSPRDETREIVVDGTIRAYTLHIPANYEGRAAVPLVLDFHPMTLGPDWERANSGFEALSNQEGFIVAWPHGLDNAWNIGPCCTASNSIDDFAFARAIVRQLSTEACVDPRRIHAVGFSLGGAMSYYLGCDQAEIFASVASSSMDLMLETERPCQPSRAISEISFRGSSDTVVPYAGGTTNPPGFPEMSFEVLGAEGTFRAWAGVDGCVGAPGAEDTNGCSTYLVCQAGTEVSLCTTQGGGQVMGDAALAWAFLKRHPMP